MEEVEVVRLLVKVEVLSYLLVNGEEENDFLKEVVVFVAEAGFLEVADIDIRSEPTQAVAQAVQAKVVTLTSDGQS